MKIQAKNLDEIAILRVLKKNSPNWTLIYTECEYSLWDAFKENPPPYKVLLAKMRAMEKKGLITGCTCGCRGDFEITDKGREVLNNAS